MLSLLETLAKIKERISKYELELRKSEALTRYVLVDPVLRTLGWDLECPNFVRPEFSTEAGTPDYALLVNGKPYVMVEVKPLRGNLVVAKDKGFNYCWKNKVPYYVITDGETWELYDMREMGGREIFSINISQDNLGNASRKLLALWRPAMPHVEIPPKQLVEPQPQKLGISLMKLFEQLKKRKRAINPPKRILFPDGEIETVNAWKDVLITIARHYSSYLSRRVPVKFMRAESILVNKSPSGMREPRQVDELWIETHFSAKGILCYSCYLLKLIGVPPENVYVEL